MGQAATHHGELRLYLAGQQVAQAITSEGTTTTTLTKGENVPGVCSVVLTGSGPSETVSYVATDGLGSVSEALSSSGTVTAQQLDGPYGVGRYASGTMPTAKGYTGQYADAASSGLDDYQARYYDAVLGQFASAESDAAGGLNRYASVHGNPETATDPTGHRCTVDTCAGGGGGGCGTTCGDGHPGHAGCGDTCGCDKSCHRPPPPQPPSGSPCGGCNARGSGGPQCDSLEQCEGMPVEIDRQRECNDPVRCAVGHDPNGLFQWLPGFGHNAEALILEGAAGLNWLLGQLAILKDEADGWFQGQEEVLGILSVLSGIAAATPGAQLVGLLGLAVTSGSGANLVAEQHTFDHMINAFTSKVEDLVEEMAYHPEWQHYEFVVGGVGGSDSDWQQQQLTIFAHAPPS